MKKNKWMDEPVLEGISKEKLKLLTEIIEGSKDKSSKELIGYFLKCSTNASKQGIVFSDEETNLILDVLKENMTPKEISKIDTIRKLSDMIYNKNKKSNI